MDDITVGETAILSVTFRDDQGQKVNASTPVEVTVRRPDGTIDGPFVASQQSVGVFEHPYPTPLDGLYFYKFVSADGGVETGTFVADSDPLINA